MVQGRADRGSDDRSQASCKREAFDVKKARLSELCGDSVVVTSELTRHQHRLLFLVVPDDGIRALRPHRREPSASDPEEYGEWDKDRESMFASEPPESEHDAATESRAERHRRRRPHDLPDTKR
jgi:hypothetical protein